MTRYFPNILSATAMAALAIIGLPSEAQNTQRLTASKTSEYGLIYTLPITAIDISVEVRTSTTQPGAFANYARRYLRINDAITEPSITADAISVTVNRRGIPAPDNRWLVQFKSGSTPFVILNEAGIPLALNTEDVYEVPFSPIPTPVEAKPTPLETDAARQAVTQEMSQSTSLTKGAELAAARIFELRETRSDLLSGQADNPPADGQAMELVLHNLAEQEAALTAMFAGTTKVSTSVKTLTFVPDSTDVTRKVLCRISPTKGVVAPDDLSGVPVYMSLTIVDRPQLPTNDKGETKRFPKGGVAYNTPGTARLTITFGENTLYDRVVELAQLGYTFGLDPAQFTDKKAPAFLIFNPVTGSIATLGTK